jgi:hypothetical protein
MSNFVVIGIGLTLKRPPLAIPETGRNTRILQKGVHPASHGDCTHPKGFAPLHEGGKEQQRLPVERVKGIEPSSLAK